MSCKTAEHDVCVPREAHLDMATPDEIFASQPQHSTFIVAYIIHEIYYYYYRSVTAFVRDATPGMNMNIVNGDITIVV